MTTVSHEAIDIVFVGGLADGQAVRTARPATVFQVPTSDPRNPITYRRERYWSLGWPIPDWTMLVRDDVMRNEQEVVFTKDVWATEGRHQSIREFLECEFNHALGAWPRLSFYRDPELQAYVLELAEPAIRELAALTSPGYTGMRL